MNRFAWRAARSVAEAASAANTTTAACMSTADGAIAAEGALFKAGGIDMLDLLKEGLIAPATLVSLSSIAELGAIAEEPAGAMRIGSMATLATIAGHPSIRASYAALAEVAGSSASPQIRNVATIGGNLLQRPRCWYFRSSQYHCLRKGGDRCFAISGDNRYHAIFNNRPCAIVHPSSAATVLVALAAEVELANADGNSRRLHIEDFLKGPPGDSTRENQIKPREVLTAVHLPRPAAGVRTVYLRLGEKAAFDWPLADVAVTLERSPGGHCRRAILILGAAAPAPYRALSAEKALAGRTINEAAARVAARAAIEDATPLSGNAYKLPLFETLIRRAILSAAA